MQEPFDLMTEMNPTVFVEAEISRKGERGKLGLSELPPIPKQAGKINCLTSSKPNSDPAK